MLNKEFDKILFFLEEIGIAFQLEKISEHSFLPGLKLCEGSLIIDKEQLKYVGDILHEAGHLACMPPEIRKKMNGDLEDTDLHRGGEMMAMAWSYAACIHLDIDPHIVFHEDGYKGDGKNIVQNFRNGKYLGIPLLVWCGMCNKEDEIHVSNGFPSMLSWTCKQRPD
jgi:hypothetical protein